MTDALYLEMVRYNTWANRQLIGHCRSLPAEVLERTFPGVLGTIPEIFTHLLDREARFYTATTGDEVDWPPYAQERPLEELDQLAERVGKLWEAFAPNVGDVHRPMPQGLAGYHPPVFAALTQLIAHGSEHRAQVESILGNAGLPAPGFNPWAYAKERVS